MGGWKTSLSYWVSVTFQGRAVELREGISKCTVPPKLPSLVDKYAIHWASGNEERRPACETYLQWLFLVPVKGGRWHSPSPNWQEKCHLYTTYGPCLLRGYMLPIPPFTGTISTTIDIWRVTEANPNLDHFPTTHRGRRRRQKRKELEITTQPWHLAKL